MLFRRLSPGIADANRRRPGSIEGRMQGRLQPAGRMNSALQQRAARRDRPQRLDPIAADADIPIVEVDRGIAVPRDQPELVADPEAAVIAAAAKSERAVLVGSADIGDLDRTSTRLNSSHSCAPRMPSSA